MSGSSAFANYSNTAQQLSAEVTQAKPTTQQITDDKNNFEQQFLIGASLMAKGKAADKLAGLFKKSKSVLKDKTEAQIKKIAQSAQDRAGEVSKKLASKIKGVKPETGPASDNLSQVKGLADDAKDAVNKTTKDLENANNDMIDARSDVADAYDTRDAANALVDANKARSLTQAGGPIKQSQQVSDSVDRDSLNDATTGVEQAELRSQAAEDARNSISQKLTAQQNTAQRATQDVKNAGGEADEVAEGALKAEKIAKDADEGLKVVKDVDKVAEASSEADPLGLVIAGVAAIATQIIGRRMKVHENVISAAVPSIGFSATLGA